MVDKDTAERAVYLKHNGHNCCQAVTAALGGETTLPGDVLMPLSAGFCAGMGNMQATCGALIGAVMIAGLRTDGKGTLSCAKKISESFKKRCGALHCADLKGAYTGKVICPCDDCVRNAVLAYGEVMNGA
ncbi:MAG: C_GCAxxG_C_C family protein [Oscillospiraceae bacterium]|nr:C_GCAxxG_C_C family protein [Oscillospiraceae bacterium]